MILNVPSVLSPQNLSELSTIKDSLAFVDGKATAGWHAKLVKDNRQAAASDALQAAQTIILGAIAAHPIVRSYALPHRISAPLISSYKGGESYGLHVDEAIMGSGSGALRTDISVTVFLANPETYEGGELEVQTPGGAMAAKFKAGDAALYPSTTLHRVQPVTSGERVVAVAWIQSLVRNAEQREILYDLDRTRRIVFEARGKSEVFDMLTKTHANLQRMWADI
jgi:PKHD-type hydroxylase